MRIGRECRWIGTTVSPAVPQAGAHLPGWIHTVACIILVGIRLNFTHGDRLLIELARARWTHFLLVFVKRRRLPLLVLIADFQQVAMQTNSAASSADWWSDSSIAERSMQGRQTGLYSCHVLLTKVGISCSGFHLWGWSYERYPCAVQSSRRLHGCVVLGTSRGLCDASAPREELRHRRPVGTEGTNNRADTAFSWHPKAQREIGDW